MFHKQPTAILKLVSTSEPSTSNFLFILKHLIAASNA